MALSSGYLSNLGMIITGCTGDQEDGRVNVRAGISVPSDLGQIRRGDLTVGQSIPVDLAEPGMGKDVAGAVLEISVALGGVAFHELEDEICRMLVEGGPPDERRSPGDFLVEEYRVSFGLVVRWEAGEHLEDKDAEGVPVDGFVVPMLADDLQRSERCGETRSERLASGAR